MQFLPGCKTVIGLQSERISAFRNKKGRNAETETETFLN
jgi:hypothetical protein